MNEPSLEYARIEARRPETLIWLGVLVLLARVLYAGYWLTVGG